MNVVYIINLYLSLMLHEKVFSLYIYTLTITVFDSKSTIIWKSGKWSFIFVYGQYIDRYHFDFIRVYIHRLRGSFYTKMDQHPILYTKYNGTTIYNTYTSYTQFVVYILSADLFVINVVYFGKISNYRHRDRH